MTSKTTLQSQIRDRVPSVVSKENGRFSWSWEQHWLYITRLHFYPIFTSLWSRQGLKEQSFSPQPATNYVAEIHGIAACHGCHCVAALCTWVNHFEKPHPMPSTDWSACTGEGALQGFRGVVPLPSFLWGGNSERGWQGIPSGGRESGNEGRKTRHSFIFYASLD